MHYKNKNFRLSEELYEYLKLDKPRDMSWNQFFFQLWKVWRKYRRLADKRKGHKIGQNTDRRAQKKQF